LQRVIIIIVVVVLGVIAGFGIVFVGYTPGQTAKDSSEILAGVSEEDKLALCGDGIVKSNEYIKEYLIPTYCSASVGIVVDRDGKVWFAETLTGKLGIFDPDTERFQEIKIPDWKTRNRGFGSMVWGMKFDPGGNLWFTDEIGNAIRKYDTKSGKFEIYKIPTKGSYPVQVAFDAAGNVWFAEIFGKKIGKIDPELAKDGTSEGIIEFAPDATGLETMGQLIVDHEGSIWFTMLDYPTIGKLFKYDPELNKFTTYVLPNGTASPVGIVEDNSGNLWINDHGTNLFFKFDTQSQKITKYSTSLPQTNHVVSLPYWNVIDDKGRIWFNLHQGNAIAVFDPTQETLIEYDIAKGQKMWGYTTNPLQFALAPDGKVWFTQWTENKIAVLDPTLPIPLLISTDDRSIELKPNTTSTITIQVKSDERTYSPVRMNVSGTFIISGKLWNIDVNFSSTELQFDEPSTKTVALSLTPRGDLPEGDHTIMIGARYDGITYSTTVRVKV